MQGCIGVAPGFDGAAMSSQDSGYPGGNMDFNLIGEGTTVYLGVNRPTLKCIIPPCNGWAWQITAAATGGPSGKDGFEPARLRLLSAPPSW
jgi:hypothetical protein